jgi:hypothetical protein
MIRRFSAEELASLEGDAEPFASAPRHLAQEAPAQLAGDQASAIDLDWLNAAARNAAEAGSFDLFQAGRGNEAALLGGLRKMFALSRALEATMKARTATLYARTAALYGGNRITSKNEWHQHVQPNTPVAERSELRGTIARPARNVAAPRVLVLTNR